MVDKIVQEGKSLLAREKAKILIEEAEILSEQDLRGALGMLREAFQLSPDYPDLEDEIYLREDAIEKLDGVLKHIGKQLEEGKNYRAFQLLQELPENFIILDKSGTVQQLSEKVEKVQGIIDGARNLPRSGNSPALQMLEEAFALMPDYPGLRDDIEALNKSQQHYNDYISGVEIAASAGDIVKSRNLLEKFKTVYAEDVSIGRLEVLIRNREKEIAKQKSFKKNLIQIVSAIACVLILIGVYFTYETISFGAAEKKWIELQSSLIAEEYTEVNSAGEAIKNMLAKVKFTSQQKKNELLAKVEEVLNSEDVIQGAQGKILVDGSYISKESLSGAQEVKKVIGEAAKLLSAGEFTASITRFKDARKITGDIDAKLAAKLNKQIDTSANKARLKHLESILNNAKSLHKIGSLEEAIVQFSSARSMAQKYGYKRNTFISRQIEKGAVKTKNAKLESMIAEGDELLHNAEYENAITAYKKALDFARLSKIDSNKTVNNLYGSINRARIYGLLAKGDENFTATYWIDSIKFYNNAIELSVKAGLSNLPILDQAVNNIKLAEKKITLDELKRLELSADELFAAEKWQEAYETYKNLVAIAGRSELKDSPEFSEILINANGKFAAADERIFISTRKEYLMEKYRGILKNAFATSSEITFLNPEVILLNSDEKVMNFSLTAKSYVKKSGSEGKYAIYEVQFAYDREKESWHLVNKASTSQ